MAINQSEIRNWVIYKITSPSGRIYIGKTARLKARISNYRTLSGNTHEQPVLFNSIKKYGFDNHTFEILDSFSSNCEYAGGKEIFWIRSFMSNRTKYPQFNGMNLTDGGDGVLGYKFIGRISPFKGKKHSDESKRLIRESIAMSNRNIRRGFKMSNESKCKMSLAKKGKQSSFKGKTHTDEYKIWASESRKGKPNLNRRGKGLWSDEDKKRIGESKKGNQYTKGMKWSEETKIKQRESALGRSKPILQYSHDFILLQEYRSKRDAERITGISRSSINRNIAQCGEKNINGFYFKYKQP